MSEQSIGLLAFFIFECFDDTFFSCRGHKNCRLFLTEMA